MNENSLAFYLYYNWGRNEHCKYASIHDITSLAGTNQQNKTTSLFPQVFMNRTGPNVTAY